MRYAKYRVLFVCSHPVQYMAPLFRRMAQHPQLEMQVAYCSLQGASRGFDREFGIEVQWDTELLEGYPWVAVLNRSPRPGIGRFFGLFNPGLWPLVAKGGLDAVVIYTGYLYASFWLAFAAAKWHRKALLYGTDAHELRSRDARVWKTRFKRWFWPRLFRLADTVIVPSTASVRLMHSLGLPPKRVVLTPYVVDNDWWLERSSQVNRAAVRCSWNVPENAPVVLFCAKLQPWKRPHDVLHAFAEASVPGTCLIFAGDGPLREPLEAETRSRGLSERVRFLGFTNQSQLPAVYRAADLFVLPSEYEPFGVVVNEAMLCGCAVAVSDRVGASFDLVRPGVTGVTFPAGDTDALAVIFRDLLGDPVRLRRMGEEARRRMENWSPKENIEATVKAIELALQSRDVSRAGGAR